MENTYTDAAHELLAHCLAGTAWPEASLDRLIEPAGNRAHDEQNKQTLEIHRAFPHV